VNKHPERIERLIERSSLGTADARAARASVSRRSAERVVNQASSSAISGRYVTGAAAAPARHPRTTATSARKPRQE